MLIWSRDLLLMFGASENTIGYAADYMRIYAIGTLLVQLTLGMNAFITAQGFATTGMLTVLIGAVANIVLDPIFIYGLHMGVRGAALATILSQGLSCIWVLRFLTGPKTLLRLKKETSELGLAPRIEVINEYLEASIEEIDQRIQAIPSSKNAAWDELNTLFLKVIGLEG